MRSEMAEWMAAIRSGGTSDLRDFPPELPSMLESGRSQTPERRMTACVRYFFRNLLKSAILPPPGPPRLCSPPGADKVRLVLASRYLVFSSSGVDLY